MTTRIQPLSSPFSPEAAATLDHLRFGLPEPPAIFRTLAHNPRVLARVWAGGLLDRGSISVRQREIVILRTTAVCGAEYEWGVHVAGFSAQAGLNDADVAATRSGDVASFSEEERVLFAMVDALHRHGTLDDATYASVSRFYEPAQIIELVVLAGLYHAISFTVRALGVPLEPWAPRFPG